MTEQKPYGQVMDEIDHDAKLAQESGPTHRVAYVTVPIDTLRAAVHAFRSYQFGNGSPALGEACADQIEGILAKAGVKL